MTLQDIPPYDLLHASGSRTPHEADIDAQISPKQPASAKAQRPRTLRSTQTMHEPRLLQQHFPPQAYFGPTGDDFEPGTTPLDGLRAPIVIRPSGRPGFNAPKAATFFLGKDHERWRRYDRDRMGLGIAWARIASAVSSRSEKRASRGSRGAFSDTDETDEDLSDGAASTRSGRSMRSRSSRHSQGRGSRRPSIALSPPQTPLDCAPTRMRRFSSNSSEASFMRHETVIGLHTPRRQSLSSSMEGHGFLRPLAQIRPASGSPSSVAAVADKPTKKKEDRQKSKRQDQERKEERAQRRAEKEREKELSRHKIKEQSHDTLDLGEAARPSLRRLRSNLEEAAAAAAASMADDSVLGDAADDDLRGVDILRSTLSDAALDGKGPMSATDLRSMAVSSDSPLPSSPLPRAASPRAPPLKLAKRRKPQHVEGTLYDKTGPHREGAVTDGLSVRLFSCEDGQRQAPYEDADLSNPENPVTKPWGRRGSSSSSIDDEDALYMRSPKRPQSADGSRSSSRRSSMHETDGAFSSGGASSAVEEGDADYHTSKSQVYLITTPDNRVSSAAKLRRWAMDGDGRFYAAMEIKSVEAKLRAADPSIGPATRRLAKELQETYLEDILDEVQKAETLNPTRTGAVSKVLKTEDDRYVRLEEDYPEEAFFVIAGCEDVELYPVLALIFTQAIRTLASFHAAGWMHGDVKLENMMFDEAGRLVVIDYENANPYRGIPGGDGTVQLVSYDWIPPEAAPGPMGRRMGPSGDLWALGCNLIRAFALRDGIEDLAIRDMLLGDGQKRFLEFVSKLITRRDPNQGGASPQPPQQSASGESAPPTSAFEIDLEPIFADSAVDDDGGLGQPAALHPHGLGCREREGSYDAASTTSSTTASSLRTDHSVDTSVCSCTAASSSMATSPRSTVDGHEPQQVAPTPSRLLYRFARSAPELLGYVLTRCVSADVSVRGTDAEVEGLRLATWLEAARPELVAQGQKAVQEAIEMSGSSWVRPRLDEARRSLGLE